MGTQTFALFQCWKNERIGQVINKEAASVDTATFLATHVPLNKITYRRAPQAVTDTSENGLLQELRRSAEQDSHTFIIVQGIPGTGKSHLIRWLKERYAAEADPHERVLFIERAQSSLRSTLEQIIQSGVFDSEHMKEQLERLNSARIELSKDALSDTLLGQLSTALHEVKQVEMPRWLARQNKLEKYLLDFVVRRELTKAGGPIDRIAHFLRSGSDTQNHEVPRFAESDFIFKAVILRQIEGYREAKYLAEQLQGEESAEARHELVAYLNQLLPFVIGHATALTSDDFKQIFFDLRRQLRRQNQTLTLFIEDITALTGIDTGLLDVLATQHVGEGNQELCRIASIVGITDSYFMDYFPDNMKDRVTHRLTLNATQNSLSDTELLANSDATADLAAHYLNAMRLEQSELEEWLKSGGKPGQLPDACSACTYKKVCHESFGARSIAPDGEHRRDIGLYPFNQKAIWTLYQHIDTSSSRRTPRSLLNNVLHYIMQSHGPKVEQGLFPPAASELGNEFTTFSLAKMQQNVIAYQGGNDARRIETLMMIWGNGTVDAEKDKTRNLVGGLPQEVFRAFGIKLIQGESITTTTSNTTSRKSTADTSEAVTSASRAKPTSESKGETIVPSPLNQPTDAPQNRYVRDITDWFNGGKLIYYSEYREWLVPLLRSFINWDFYGISDKQLDEALKEKRIYIERQDGKMNVAHYLKLDCSAELMAALLGLVSIRGNRQELEDEVLSGSLSNFSIWLRMNEGKVVEFVKQPHSSVSNLLPLNEMLLFNCLIMACLQGALLTSYQSTQDMWLDLVKFCINTRNSPATWEQFQQRVGQQHSHIWASLARKITPKRASEQCSLLLSTFNCSQGGSNDIRYLDTPTALLLLKRLIKNDLQSPDTASLDSNAVIPWGETQSVYSILQSQFTAALNDDCSTIQSMLTNLSTFMGDSSPKDVFQSLQTFVQTTIEKQRGTSFNINRSLNATQFTTMRTRLQSILKENEQGQLALLLSNSGSLQLQAREYIAYFESFLKEATKLKEANIKKLAQSPSQEVSKGLAIQEDIRSLYQEIIDALRRQPVKEEKR